ncbi:MAG: DUF6470 family protein [Acidobacteriota bacterium]
MELKVEQTFAQIGIQFRIPVAEIQMEPASFEQEQVKDPQIIIDNIKEPKIHIDQTQCWADMGMRSSQASSDYYSAKAWSHGLQAIAEIVQEGRSLASIDKGYTIAQDAKAHTYHIQEFGLGLVPKQGPKISFDLEYPRISAEQAEFSVRLELGKLRVQAPYEDVKVFYRVPPKISVSVSGSLDEIG